VACSRRMIDAARGASILSDGATAVRRETRLSRFCKVELPRSFGSGIRTFFLWVNFRRGREIAAEPDPADWVEQNSRTAWRGVTKYAFM